MHLKLIDVRNALKKTQRQVAEEAGISRAFYTNIENGDRSPSLDVAQRIAESLGRPGDMTLFLPVNVSERHIASA